MAQGSQAKGTLRIEYKTKEAGVAGWHHIVKGLTYNAK